MSFYLFVSIVLTMNIAKGTAILDPLSDEFIDYLNSNQTLWKAGRNFHPKTPLTYFKNLMGSLKDDRIKYLPQKRFKKTSGKLPKNFDGRKKWTNCPTLNHIRDQGSCGSCWAVSASSAMTDRICIRTNGTTNFYFSEDDILSCCNNCGKGCLGGYLSKAWQYVQIEGTVSGGTYNSTQGCRPYEIPPCKHEFGGHRPQCGIVDKPKCVQMCQKNYLKKYSEDQRKIGTVYCMENGKGFKKEIYKNGPITSSMKVYADLLHYKSGVYRHTGGDYLGDHSFKILGWGVENRVKYWLVANSWNTDWGDNGFFKILRGNNHCGIEGFAVAAYILP